MATEQEVLAAAREFKEAIAGRDRIGAERDALEKAAFRLRDGENLLYDRVDVARQRLMKLSTELDGTPAPPA